MGDGTKNGVYMEVDAIPENVGLVRLTVAALAAQAPFSVADIEEIKVAVSEAVTNAMLHGYRSGPGTIKIWLELTADGLEIAVGDEGEGIESIEECRRSGPEEDPERLGLGFMFMESFMDRLEIQSAPGKGTTVKMSRRLPGTGTRGG